MYNGSVWTSYDVSDGLVGPVVKAIDVDGANNVWVTTSTGVSKLSNVPSDLSDLNKAQFKMYPNPAKGSFIIEAANKVDVVVTDLTGRVIFSEKANSSAATIGTTNWMSGIYVVSVNGKAQRLVVH